MTERRDSHRAHRMPFGQHRGKLLTELPNQYIVWLQTSATVHAPWLIEALDDEGNRRLESGEMKAGEVGVG